MWILSFKPDVAFSKDSMCPGPAGFYQIPKSCTPLNDGVLNFKVKMQIYLVLKAVVFMGSL